jgi:type I restriction enzyme S subunit
MPSEEMPTGWVRKTLGDLGRIVTGKTPSTSIPEYFGGEIPFITPSDMDGRKFIAATERNLTVQGAEAVKGSRIPAGAIMVSCIGSDMGKVAVATRDCVTNQQINSIIVSGDVSANYVFHDLSARRHELRSHAASGSAQPNLNKGDFSRLGITLPPLPEQRSIARILDALDDKIHLNRQTNQNLEDLARALFAHHFPYGPEEDLPPEWKLGRLVDIADITMGLSPNGETYNQNGVGTPLINGPVEFGDYFPVKTKWTTAPTRLCSPEDLIFCVRGSTTGRRVIADDIYCLGRGVCSIRARGPTKAFLYCLIESALDQMLSTTNGSVFPSLGAPDIKGFQVVIPPQSDLRKFSDIANNLYDTIASHNRESRILAALRDALLPKLLSGEIRVPQAEKLAESTT